MKRLFVLAAALCAGAAPMVARAQVERPSYEKPLSSEAVRDVQSRLRALGYHGGPSRETMAALGLKPDSYLSRSSRHSEAEHLNLRERQQVERGSTELRCIARRVLGASPPRSLRRPQGARQSRHRGDP